VTPPVVRWAQRVWTSDVGLSALTFLTFVLAFVLEPLADFRWASWLLLVAEIVFALFLVTAITAVTGRAWAGMLAAAFAVVFLALHAANLIDPRLMITDRLLGIVPVLVLMMTVTALSLRAGPVNYHRIAGAVLSYLLVAVLWERLYALLSHLAPGAIASAAGGSNALTAHDLMYFSISTLTTVGYGDLVPVHPAARVLASLEAIIGVLFPVVYISRFVPALQVRSER